MPRPGIVALAAALAALLGSVNARAADQVYWSNGVNNTISFARLDGTGGGQLNTLGATVNTPIGVAIDAAAGRIYWVNNPSGSISFARLDGTGGGGQLNIAGADASFPYGLAVDPAGGRIYWANSLFSGSIAFARLDGTGGGQLSIGSASAVGPEGPVVDAAAGKLYWSNQQNNTISFARLDGTGGAQLNITGATANQPSGVALDPAAGLIYWANEGNNTISFARLDGTGGGGQLNLTGATVSGPLGVAVDHAAGKIYWANNFNGTISFARLDGTGGGEQLNLNGTPLSSGGSHFPALLKAPIGSGPPAITGGSEAGATLSCSPGQWAGDALASRLSLAPQSFAFQWSVGGTDLPGATGATLTASAGGDYRCRVTASNQAGSAEQTSAPQSVAAPSGGPSGPAAPGPARFPSAGTTIKADRKGRLTFTFTAAPGLTGSASFKSTGKVRVGSGRRSVTLAARSFRVPASGRVTLKVTLSRANLRILRRNRAIRTKVTVTLRNATGQRSTSSRTVTLKAS